MAEQTAAQVRAAQQKAAEDKAQTEAATAGQETEAAQQDSEPKERTIEQPKPEMVGGVPKVRWDNEAFAPTARKSIAHDPDGLENRKLLADSGGDDE